jgi:hypothetical protein
MKNFKSIDRLYEMHAEGEVTDEILSMTVGEMLNKLEAMDTQDSAEYEIIEDAIKTLSSKLLGYDASASNYDLNNSVEGEDDYETEEGEYEEDEDMPAFNDMPGNDSLASQERGSLNDFTF